MATVIADEWEPAAGLPDEEDVAACCKSADVFFRKDPESLQELMKSMNDGEKEVFLFNCGFYRGQSWGIFKTLFNIGRNLGKNLAEVMQGIRVGNT
jgi:hypothetical protein